MALRDTREPAVPTTQKPEFSAAEIGALAHLYRGEVYRSTVWRTRLDSTTNWAVVTTGIALSATFSSAEASPLPMVLVGLSFMQEHGVPSGAHAAALSSNWLEDTPEGDHFVGSYGRVFDVIVLGRPGRDPNGSRMTTLEAALFESGRPVLIAPPWPRPQMGTNVLIAWNCSTEQARTTAFAMPILQRASRVVVLTVEGGAAVPGPTGQQLCRYLQLNGVPAKPLTVGLNGRLTGEAVLEHANALGCDLLIKGAYTQSRLRQFIFGGTTRYILSNATLPVLMAH
jgi:nucleotide-binding universal stress UspA family protein